MGKCNFIKLIDYPKYMEIEEGDVIFISSDSMIMRCDAYRSKESENSLESFIDGLVKAVGESGTIIFPTYNWDFCAGVEFDYFNTSCMTGSLGSMALKRQDFRRTKHPIYSFAVCGKYQDKLCDMDNVDSFGLDSPFNFFVEQNVKNYLIDVSLVNSFTFVHFAEQQSGLVDYRYIKEFTSRYRGEDGHALEKTYSMFVRDLELNVESTVDLLEEDLLRGGAEKILKINHSNIKKIELGKAYDIILNDIKNNNSKKICTFKGQI